MRDLLERWARLEPDRCDPTHDDIMGNVILTIRWSRDTITLVPDDYPLDTFDRTCILAAVKEAIEALGWSWKLQEFGPKPHLVRAWIASSHRHAPLLREGSTPAEALLSAYLDAVEDAREGQSHVATEPWWQRKEARP